MSDAPEAAPKPRSSAALRTVLLLLVLLIVIAAGLWDWYGAKQPRDEAYDRVVALGGTSPMFDLNKPAATQADVHKAVGVAPAESVTEEGPNGPVIYERFAWRRGIPWMTYDVWVLYYGHGDKEMLVAQKGEEGRPDPIYAANARSGEPPVPDPSTVTPPTNGPTPENNAPVGDEAPGAVESGDAPLPADGDAEKTTAESGVEESTETPAEKPAPGADSSETPEAPIEGGTEGESV